MAKLGQRKKKLKLFLKNYKKIEVVFSNHLNLLKYNKKSVLNLINLN